jgi:hypothetical protein
MNETFEDFTEKSYRAILTEVSSRRRFVSFTEKDTGVDIVLWRHDVDCSPQRALVLAGIEAEMGLQATYFFMLNSEFYNILEHSNSAIIRKIAEMGHWLGVHFDPSWHVAPHSVQRELPQQLEADLDVFRGLLGVEPVAFSFHNPDTGPWLSYDQDTVCGLVNAYGRTLREKFEYCSDSNGYWLFKRLNDVVGEPVDKPLHILTHPEWWTPAAMNPRARIERCVAGRATGVMSRYDAFLEKHGRVNIR